MPEQDALERSYRRWLRAYPRFYRRDRGLEILTTLLDASRPGQRRASRDEAAHLLLSGLRYRLVPPGWAGKLAAGVATLWLAVVLGGAGAYAAWVLAPADRPGLDEPRIAALSDGLVGRPATSVDLVGGDPLDTAYSYRSGGDLQTFAAEGWSGARPAPGRHTRGYELPGQAQAVLADAHRRLRDAGWRTGVETRPADCACGVFWASRDGLLLRVSGQADAGARSAVVVSVHAVEPDGVDAAAIAGSVLGLVVAWPVVTWLTHRFARAPRGTRLVILLFGVPALYACAANTVDSVLSMLPEPGGDSVLLAADLMYPLANLVVNPPAAIVVALGLAVSTGAVAVMPRRQSPPWTEAASPGIAVAENR